LDIQVYVNSRMVPCFRHPYAYANDARDIHEHGLMRRESCLGLLDLSIVR
jgi:hypothetical protein